MLLASTDEASREALGPDYLGSWRRNIQTVLPAFALSFSISIATFALALAFSFVPLAALIVPFPLERIR